MLSLVGLGLKAKDLTLEGLDLISASEHIFYEDYTSVIDWIHELEGITGKRFRKLERSDMEEKSGELIELASATDIVILVSGDPIAATTHQSLLVDAKKKGVRTKIVHAPSVLTAIGETGLWLYKFGRVVTIPKQSKLDSVKEFIDNNRKIGLHTLVLLDIGMTAVEGIKRLIDGSIIKRNEEVIACSKLGTSESRIIRKSAGDTLKEKIEGHPQCLVIPGKVHGMEEL
jgi:diphthine synthase